MSKSPDKDIDIDRTDEILRFVRENPRSTKSDVIRHMKGKSAVTTTHALITSLINEGKISVYKVNIQTHLLTINEKNHFNKFHRLLSEIDSLISRAEGEAFPTGVIQDPDGVPIVTTDTSTIFPDEDDKQYRKLGTALQGLRNYYRQSFFLIIQILYNKIERSLQSQKKDRVILFRMLNSLTARLSLHPLDEKTARELLATYTKNIEKYVREYNRYKYVKDKTDLGDKLIETIENFKKEFLSETEQKTKKPGEKSG